MKAEAFLAAAETLPFRGLDAVTGGGGLVVVAPHPDDESLGCGGLIRAACLAGVAVRVVVVSDGVGSHPNSAAYPPARLRALRQAETRAAVAELGLAGEAIRFLDLPDRFVPSAGPQAEAARDAVLEAADAVAAGAICVTWGHDPHCDHVAAAAIVAQCRFGAKDRRMLAYPVWGWTLPPGTEVGAPPRGLRFDIGPHVAVKRKAIAAHRSQTTDLIDDDPDGFRLSPAMIARFSRPWEIYLDMDVDPHADPEVAR